MDSRASPEALNSSPEKSKEGLRRAMSEHEVVLLPQQRGVEVPFATYKRGQAALPRLRLYPLSAFYTLYAILVLAVAFSTTHPWIAVSFFWAGCATWNLVAYPFHPSVLPRRFPPC